MKITTHIIVILISLFVLLLMLAGCSAISLGSSAKEENARKAAEEYADKLRAAVGDDSIYFTEDAVGRYGDDLFSFTLGSEMYEQNFVINVNGNIITDSYSLVTANDSAKEEWAKILDGFPGYHISYEVGVDTHNASSTISMTTFGSIYDAQNAYGYPSIVQATITFNNDESPSQEKIYNILSGLFNQGLLGKITIAGDDAIYEVDKDGLYFYRPSGADNGNYTDRVPFTPDVE